MALGTCSHLRAQEPIELVAPSAVERLCRTLRLDGGAPVPPGDPLRRGWSKVEREQRRDEALDRSYRIWLGSEDFHFDDFDPAAAVLPLHLQDGLAAFGGRLRLRLPPGEQVQLGLGPQEVQLLVEAHASHRVRLQVDFVLDAPEDATDVCGVVQQVNGRPVRLVRVIPQTYRWIDSDGRVLAVSVGAPEPPPAAPAASGAAPVAAAGPPLAPRALPSASPRPAPRAAVEQRVEKNVRVRVAMARVVGEAGAGSADDLSLDLEPYLAPLLLPCLQQRVGQLHHAVEGSLVVDVRVGGLGLVQQVWVRRRLLEDEELLRCVLGRLHHAPLLPPPGAAGRRPMRLRVPIFFQTGGQR